MHAALGCFAVELRGLDAVTEQLEGANGDSRDREDASLGEPEAVRKKATQNTEDRTRH